MYVYTDLTLYFFGAVSQNHLTCCLLGCSAHLAQKNSTHNTHVVYFFQFTLINIFIFKVRFSNILMVVNKSQI